MKEDSWWIGRHQTDTAGTSNGFAQARKPRATRHENICKAPSDGGFEPGTWAEALPLSEETNASLNGHSNGRLPACRGTQAPGSVRRSLGGADHTTGGPAPRPRGCKGPVSAGALGMRTRRTLPGPAGRHRGQSLWKSGRQLLQRSHLRASGPGAGPSPGRRPLTPTRRQVWGGTRRLCLGRPLVETTQMSIRR